MPPLKRRSDAISRDASRSEPVSDEEPQPRRRRRSSSESSDQSSASGASLHGASTRQTQDQTLIKKLVRLALATEYSRTPLRRSDITTKIFKDSSNGPVRSFKAIFDGAQKILQDTFGMQMVELPSKEKTSLKDRRQQTTQTKSTSSTSKSWILTSTLPSPYKTNPTIIQPTRAPDAATEASYTALSTFIVSLIYLNNNELPDSKLTRYMKRVNADTNTPFGMLDKVLQRMQREGYIDKRRENINGEDNIQWFIGPRGKVEIGVGGVAGLVKTVYGHGAVPLSKRSRAERDGEAPDAFVKMEVNELNARLSRSLKTKFAEVKPTTEQAPEADGSGEEEAAEGSDDGGRGDAGPSRTRQQQQQQRQKQKQTQRAQPTRQGGGRRAAQNQDEDDDDDDDDDENDD